MSAQLTPDDVASVFRLTRNLLERWDDPAAWREDLLRGACGLLGGHVAVMFGETEPGRDGFGKVAVIATVPSELLLQKSAAAGARSPHEAHHGGQGDGDGDGRTPALVPSLRALYSQFERHGGRATARRSEVSDAPNDPAAPLYLDARRRVDADDYLISIHLVDLPRRAEGMVIYRPRGSAPFGARDVMLLKLLHDELAPLVGVRLATEAHLSRDGLSARLREALSLLLDGLGEKQLAARLHVSRPTVHEYIGTLYRHFEVGSRAELLAYFIRRTPVSRTGK
jgi:DNA-binding CsgD family transcriptional regulator